MNLSVEKYKWVSYLNSMSMKIPSTNLFRLRDDSILKNPNSYTTLTKNSFFLV